MADLTWYSREGADSRFLTKQAAAALATEQSRASGDAALGQRIDVVSATAEAALPRSEASQTYATKEALAQAQLGGGGQAPDLSAYATKSEMQAADGALGTRIDSLSSTVSSVSAKADAAAPREALTAYQTTEAAATAAQTAAAAVSETYATKASLADYLPKTEAAGVYATKSDLANAQLGGKGGAPDLSHLATKAEVSSADTALGQRIDSVKATADAAAPLTALSGYVTTTDAQATYETKADASQARQELSGRVDSLSTSVTGAATKAELSSYLTTAAAQATYATKSEVEAAKPDLSTYATKESMSAYLTASDAETAYATKEELTKAQLAGDGKIPDLSGYVKTAQLGDYALKTELAQYARTSALSPISAKADAALPKIEAAATYATIEAVTEAKRIADAALPKIEATETYVTKGDFETFKKTPGELTGYVKKGELTALEGQIDALIADQSPFKAGARYSSPVTYYWPDYYNESKGTSKWAKALKAGSTLGIVILNKDSGNWDEKNVDFGKQAQLALSSGAKRAVFYVKTQYGVASLPSSDPARNGVPNPDKYTKEYILGQIAKFTEQYGEVVGGVFLDETINGWGAQAGRVAWYRDLIDSIRAEYGKGFLIVVNAGSNMSQDVCALDFDVAMMFEQDAAKFLNEDPNTPILPDHMRAYPSNRWWAVVHGVTKDNYKRVFEKADSLPIGHLYITDGVLVEDPNRGGQWEPVGNPYANPPSEQLIRLTSAWIRGTLELELTIEDLKAQIAELKKGGGGGGAAPKNPFLVLGPNDPIPAGTPNDTVIIRKEA